MPGPTTAEQLHNIQKEIDLLPELIKLSFNTWEDGAKDFQLEGMRAQLQKIDVLIHAATGAGKTGIAAAPHLLPSSKGKITLVVSPLIALQDEQVDTFKDEFNLKAIAINSNGDGCSQTVMDDVVQGTYQIVILSPEMLLSRRFIDNVLRRPEFGTRCLSIFIDEAHCISHWGNSFRKKYSSIGIVRAFLPKDTPIIAVTATLTPRVKEDIVSKLQLKPNYLFINMGNNRPNVAQVVRAMEHPMNSHRDLEFLVPETLRSPLDISKTFLYTDDVKEGILITDYLNSRVPQELRSNGLVRPYNAAMSKRYRKGVMRLFRAGTIRILVCTDAAGMGCNISDIDVVVQWKLPQNLSSWVQRSGRAGRSTAKQGLAIMIVEKGSFEVNTDIPTNNDTDQQQPRTSPKAGKINPGRRQRNRPATAKHGPAWGILHGSKRGQHDGKHDTEMKAVDEPSEVPWDASREGLYLYVQTTNCRRRLLAYVFQNREWNVPAERCCDICNPALFDKARPAKPLAQMRGARKAKRGLPLGFVRQALYEWRRSVKRELYPLTMLAPQSILDSTNCELLSSVGPIKTITQLALLLQTNWARWDALGNRLFEMLTALDIPELPMTKLALTKRTATAAGLPDSDLTSSASSLPTKRSRPGPAVDTPFPTSAYDMFFNSGPRYTSVRVADAAMLLNPK